jgi:trk system potassium uptake protein TrkA
MRKNYGLNVMAIKRGEEVIVSPGAEDFITKGDILVVVGQNKDIEKLEKLV